MSSKGSITQLIICNGILHTDAISPEKRLEDISASSMLRDIECKHCYSSSLAGQARAAVEE